MTDHDKTLIEATVRETLRQMGAKTARTRRPAKGAPDRLAAWLAERERVTLAETLPVLGLAHGKRGASLAGACMKAAGWHRVGRDNGPAGQVWFYERKPAEQGGQEGPQA